MSRKIAQPKTLTSCGVCRHVITQAMPAAWQRAPVMGLVHIECAGPDAQPVDLSSAYAPHHKNVS